MGKLFNGLYLPITILISYLGITLILFEFGPIDYYTPDKALFYFYQFYYLTALFIGYLGAINVAQISRTPRPGRMVSFKFLLILALCTSLIENANIAKLGSFVPTNIINLVTSGFNLSSVGDAYYSGKVAAETYSSNRLLNILSLFFSWSRLFLIIYVGYSIHRLTRGQIFWGLFVSLLYPLGALSLGLNKPVMEFAIIFLISVLISMTINRAEISDKVFHQLKLWRRIGIILVLFGVWSFSNAMESRGVTIFFLEYTSPAGYISVNCSFCTWDATGFTSGMIWFVNYVVQGYHGFSLAIQETFTSTMGFGSSSFLLRQSELVSGVDLRPLTYQYKTSGLWGETSHWHSIYTHFANDVHFLGVGILMLLIGGMFGFTWKLSYIQKNVYASILIPIYALMFVFFPANNQIFGFISSLSAFSFANFLMIKVFLQTK